LPIRAFRIRVFLVALAASRTLSAQATTSTTAPAPAPSAKTQADDAPPVEITVRGTRPTGDVGTQTIRAESMRDIPGTFGEPFQAIASLPGVLPVASGVPYFYVRGAPPANTGYFFDGIPVPMLFHIGPGPSVVPPALLQSMEFFPGTAPARFGRFAGGIISGEMTAPAEVARGEATVRWFDASAFVETPLDAASTVLVAGRYGYPNLLLSIFAPDLSLSYGDYTLRLTRKLGPADAISVFALGSYDKEQGLVPIDTLFHRLDSRYDHTWIGGSFRLAATLGYDRTTAPLLMGSSETVAETSARLRFELKQRVGPTLRLNVGADVNASLDRSGASALYAQQVAGASADATYRPTDRVELVVGLRMDAYRSSSAITTSVDPRIALRVRVTRALTSVTTLGIAHQPPTHLLPTPGLSLDPSGGLQTVYQYAQGAEVRLPWALGATVTGFYIAAHDVNDFVSDCGTFSTGCSLVARVDGSSYGLELNVQRAFARSFTGWLSYTLSRAERHIGATPFLSPFDRTHVLAAVLRYDLGAGIDVGVRATYNTGRPDIPSFSQNGISVPVTFESAAFVPQHRLPAFYRIDLRAQKRWSFGRRWLAVVVEFFDATLNPEAVDFVCSLAQGVCTAQKVGPIALPSIGLDAGF
jgi:hypothetical protein